ncbi:MAG TPA: hypothetical protein VHZ78_09650 [Rhizomicrobium sp.]|jgi:hypothetical protein|nr:hypothetical protein [Rhizomicrobium sp.]
MKTKIILFAAVGVSLAACGGGVSTPDAVRGKWGTECSAPTIQIDASALHILYPQAQDFDLTAAELDGTTLKLSLVNEGKKITDVYEYANDTLTPTQVIIDGQTFSGDRIPLNKCGT